jgi:transaldolase
LTQPTWHKVKKPMIKNGVKALKYFKQKDIKTNCTLVFLPGLALPLLAAKARAAYVSTFIGRLDDISTDILQLVGDTGLIYDNYGYETQIRAASVRHAMYIVNCAKLSADAITGPLSAIIALLKHSLQITGLRSSRPTMPGPQVFRRNFGFCIRKSRKGAFFN